MAIKFRMQAGSFPLKTGNRFFCGPIITAWAIILVYENMESTSVSGRLAQIPSFLFCYTNSISVLRNTRHRNGKCVSSHTAAQGLSHGYFTGDPV